VAQRRLAKFMEKDRCACVKCEPNQPQGFRVNTQRTLVANYSGTSSMTLSTRRPQGCSLLVESHMLDFMPVLAGFPESCGLRYASVHVGKLGHQMRPTRLRCTAELRYNLLHV
jgi:hypothetical protein